MTNAEFYNAVEHFDWFHEMSDDHRVYVSGVNHWAELQQEAGDDPVRIKLMEDFTKHHYSGESWSTPKAPKPAAI